MARSHRTFGLIGVSAAALALAAPAARAADPVGQVTPADVARTDAALVRLAALNVPTTGAGAYGGGGSSYTPPVITNSLFMVDGDSRANNGGPDLWTGNNTFTVENADSNGWSGTLAWLSNNTMLAQADWNMAVGASTTAGIAARETFAGNGCPTTNSYSATTPCGEVLSAVQIATSGTTSAGATTVTLANVTGLSTGMYAEQDLAAAMKTPANSTIASINSGASQITLGNPTLASIASGQKFTFVPIAQVPPFWNYLDSSQTGFIVTDLDGAIGATGAYSPQTNPAKLVFFGAGTNDANFPSVAQSLRNISYILDGYGPSGANKFVIAFDEIPRGMVTVLDELHTPSAGTFTASHTSNFHADLGLWYTPTASLGTPNAIGTNDGVKLTNVNGAGVFGACTQSALTAGQYCVSSAGVYTTATADNGLALEVNYTYATGASGNLAGGYLRTIHNWLRSSAATFVDPDSGQSYNCGPNATPPACSGALYNRPWVSMASTWESEVDPSDTVNDWPLAYYSQDTSGLHPLPNAGKQLARAMLAAVPAGLLPTTPIYSPPAAGAINFGFSASSNISSTGHTFTCASGSVTGIGTSGSAPLNSFLTSPNPPTSTGLYQVGGLVDVPTATLPHKTPVDCITAAGELHVNATELATSTNTSSSFQNDTGNLIYQFTHLAINTATIASCGTTDHCGTPTGLGTTITKGVPTGWTFSLGSNDTAGMNAGTEVVNYGVETNPLGDGYDSFVLQEGGYASASGSAITLQINVAAQMLDQVPQGVQLRAVCRIQVLPGPNGHLWGVNGVKFLATITQPAFTAPGSTNASTISYGGQVTGGGAGQEYVDKDLSDAGGSLKYTAITPPFKAINTPSAVTVSLVFSESAQNSGVAQPISATYRISGCGVFNAPN